MAETRQTERDSNYRHLEKMSTQELLSNINKEDKTVALAVENSIPQILPLVDVIAEKMKAGGRLFYIGAGTSGRLGIVDASECPPTFGVPHNWVIGLMAGGDKAMRKAVEFAEDDATQAWEDLTEHAISTKDVLIGIAASGSTPYVIGGLLKANEAGLITGCIVCASNSAIAKEATFPIEVITGPEFVTGSTRMKAGTAQKLVLNMISTAVMIKLGRVEDNKMVDMQLSNNKLVDRGIRMIQAQTNCSAEEAKILLEQNQSVRKAVIAYNAK